jgi:hypothetical protein
MAEPDQLTDDHLHRRLGWNVLPDAEHAPTSLPECIIDACVASDVGLKLGPPVLEIALWHVKVLRAGMPEAAIDEHGEQHWAEHDVWVRPNASGTHEPVLSKTKSEVVETSAQRLLGPRSRPAVCIPDPRREG